MRVAPLWAGLGCLLALCATLVNAHQPTSAVGIGLEKRVQPLEAGWAEIADEASVHLHALVGNHVMRPGAASVTNALDNLALDDVARLVWARLDRAGLDRAGLDRTRPGRAGLDRTRPGRARLDRARLDRARLDRARLNRARLDRAGLDLQRRLHLDLDQTDFVDAFINIRNVLIRLLLEPPTDDSVHSWNAFLEHFRNAARVYDVLERVAAERFVLRPLMARAHDLAPMEFWDRTVSAAGRYRIQYENRDPGRYNKDPAEIEAHLSEIDEVQAKVSQVLMTLRRTIEAYEARYPQDPALSSLMSLYGDINGARRSLSNDRKDIFQNLREVRLRLEDASKEGVGASTVTET